MRRVGIWLTLSGRIATVAMGATACGGSDGSGDAEPDDPPPASVEEDGTIPTDLGDIVANSPSSIAVADQSGDATSVLVEEVELPAAGFVLILDPAAPVVGELGTVIGTSDLLAPGASSDVEVALVAAPTASGPLVAEPHVDSNRNETLDWDPTNGPVTDLSTLPETDSSVKTFAEFDYTLE